VTTAGTRVQLNGGTSRECVQVIIQALTGNTGNIFVGDVTVASTLGMALAPGANLTLNVDANLENEWKTYLDLADIYLDTATNGNKANILVVDMISIGL
jgi:hypothetical protein